MNLLIYPRGGDFAAVVLVSRVVLGAASILVLALVPPFMHLCFVAAVGRLLAGIAPSTAGW